MPTRIFNRPLCKIPGTPVATSVRTWMFFIFLFWPMKMCLCYIPVNKTIAHLNFDFRLASYQQFFY